MNVKESTAISANLEEVLKTQDSHWVGDGFPVRTLFFYDRQGQDLSPFLLLDYAGPRDFPPTAARLGVGAHPHRGFETVTIVYSGEVEHRDSSGAGGRIGPGDVQWMTAASGLVHEEFHGRDYARRGGAFEMVQLWVNLPSAHKMAEPRYQGITADMIPELSLADNAAKLRVIAGNYHGSKGPAMTFSPVNVWDLKLSTASPFRLDLPKGHTKLLVLLRGTLLLAGGQKLGEAEVARFDRDSEMIQIDRADNVVALVLSGEPLNEPIVGYGPFVMNTSLEIHEAISDYQNGKLGQLS